VACIDPAQTICAAVQYKILKLDEIFGHWFRSPILLAFTGKRMAAT
jgi:hypothetical protein